MNYEYAFGNDNVEQMYAHYNASEFSHASHASHASSLNNLASLLESSLMRMLTITFDVLKAVQFPNLKSFVSFVSFASFTSITTFARLFAPLASLKSKLGSILECFSPYEYLMTSSPSQSEISDMRLTLIYIQAFVMLLVLFQLIKLQSTACVLRREITRMKGEKQYWELQANLIFDEIYAQSWEEEGGEDEGGEDEIECETESESESESQAGGGRVETSEIRDENQENVGVTEEENVESVESVGALEDEYPRSYNDAGSSRPTRTHKMVTRNRKRGTSS